MRLDTAARRAGVVTAAASPPDALAPQRSPASQWLQRLAAPRLTLVLLIVFGIAVTTAYLTGSRGAAWLTGPLALLGINLACSILTSPVFRRQSALLVFHLALLAIVVLVGVGQLTYLKGIVEVSTGEVFQGVLTEAEHGPLHRGGIETVAFRNDGFSVAYSPGVRRDETRNDISWIDAAGSHRAVIGDQHPLKLSGYRFYTSPNKGFAPVFTWYPAGGEPQRGTVHLPAYPLHEYRQAQSWTLPGTRTTAWLMLRFDEVLLDATRATAFRLPERHVLVLRSGTERHELAPGAAVDIAGGRLVYEGLTTWMGYTVFYDPTLPWLLAACLVAALGIGWYFWRRFGSEPW